MKELLLIILLLPTICFAEIDRSDYYAGINAYTYVTQVNNTFDDCMPYFQRLAESKNQPLSAISSFKTTLNEKLMFDLSAGGYNISNLRADIFAETAINNMWQKVTSDTSHYCRNFLGNLSAYYTNQFTLTDVGSDFAVLKDNNFKEILSRPAKANSIYNITPVRSARFTGDHLTEQDKFNVQASKEMIEDANTWRLQLLPFF